MDWHPVQGGWKYSQSFNAMKTGYELWPDEPYWIGTDFTLLLRILRTHNWPIYRAPIFQQILHLGNKCKKLFYNHYKGECVKVLELFLYPSIIGLVTERPQYQQMPHLGNGCKLFFNHQKELIRI